MPPRLSIVAAEHRDLDALPGEVVVLPLFSGTGQPQGVAGHVDWRLCGRLAGLLRDGRFRGAAGETSLLSYAARVGTPRILLFGLGPEKRALAEATVGLERLGAVLADAMLTEVALAPPSVALAEAWLAAPAWKASPLKTLALLDAGKTLDGAREALARAAARGGLTLGGD